MKYKITDTKLIIYWLILLEIKLNLKIFNYNIRS